MSSISHNYRKQCKYQKLAFEIKQQWQLNMIIVTPLVSSAMGVNPSMLNPFQPKLMLAYRKNKFHVICVYICYLIINS